MFYFEEGGRKRGGCGRYWKSSAVSSTRSFLSFAGNWSTGIACPCSVDGRDDETLNIYNDLILSDFIFFEYFQINSQSAQKSKSGKLESRKPLATPNPHIQRGNDQLTSKIYLNKIILISDIGKSRGGRESGRGQGRSVVIAAVPNSRPLLLLLLLLLFFFFLLLISLLSYLVVVAFFLRILFFFRGALLVGGNHLEEGNLLPRWLLLHSWR